MNKNLLLTYLLLCFSLTLKAQTDVFSISPVSPVSISGDSDDYEIVAKSTITNNTDQELRLTWVRIVNDLANPSWQTLVCDNITCWGPTRNENTFGLTPNGEGNLDVHFQTDNEPGSGSVELLVYAIDDSANVNMTITYEADAWTVGIDDDEPVQELKIYPNPVRNFINIDYDWSHRIETVEIYNIIGKKIATYTIPAGYYTYRIDTDQLDEGMYFISLINDRQELVTTKTFSKVE